MNCQEVVESMHRYLDRDLSSDETALMYQHIAVCPSCAETFQLLKSLSKELEELPAVTPPISLVDAIMPRLDAIDRERGESPAPSKEISSEPAEMTPEIRRPRRQANWWSTIGGRTAIGAAAAAVILGVAIFSFEPKVISEAELPYEEAETLTNETSAAGENHDAEQPEASMMMEDAPAGSVMDSGDDGDAAGAADAHIYTAPSTTSQDDAPGITPDSKPDHQPEEPSEKVSEKLGPQESAPNDSSTPSASNDPQGTNSTRNSQTPGSNNPSEGSESTPPTAAVPPHAAESLPPESDGRGEGPSNQAEVNPPEAGALESSQPEGGRLDMGLMATVPAAVWTSPDGKYMIQLEANDFIVYSVPTDSNVPAEIVESVPLKGEWVAGEWVDNQTFRYRLKVEEQTVESVYTVKKSSSSQETSGTGTSGSSGGQNTPARP
ncbi:anti-sigma factor [Paenibacillus campinasensis]|uniref:Anti-sigma-W factor RsiW n=1 Tax=Paenibacillus campinasensis TaxID=66347 RepID=A0ABW9SUA8_9BACL|nr:zf-HC2 domain-containing protein [Paenibacillus campinasensis]MUG64560.1 anti-sigma factor [Paenibacillus campinasensis]